MLLENLRGTYNQVANEYLQDLRSQTGPSCKHLLQDTNQEMPQRRTDECPVNCHFGHPRAKVVAMFANVMRNPRCKDFL